MSLTVPIDFKQSQATEDAVESILRNIGEDPERDGLKKTPERIAKMYAELTEGYHQDLKELVNGALFDVDYADLVLVKDIEFFSLCEHHMLPFFGKATVAYLPSKKVLGLSKIPRIVSMYAKRLQVQERMTQEILAAIEEAVNPQGVAVYLQAQHMCSSMRGVKNPNSNMMTRAYSGVFKESQELRQEFVNFVNS